MKAGPDIAMVAALVGDPARSNMLTALMSGRALTASELAHEAGITPQTASSQLTNEGRRFMASALQISAEMLNHPRRPVCKACLDWSERRHHLAGTLGAAVMTRFTELKWAARDSAPGSRVVNFSRTGEKRFAELFGSSE